MRCVAGLEVELEVDLVLGYVECVGVVYGFLRLQRRSIVAEAVRASRAVCPMLSVFRR
jgi:hypothetical protein